MGLAQDAAHELGQRALRAGTGQNRQHVGERAVPPLLQRLLGDDEPDRAVTPQEAAGAGVVHLLQVVARAGLDGDLFRGDVRMLQQVLAGVLGVHHARLPLVAAGALHLNQADRSNIGAGDSLVPPGALFQFCAVLDRGQQSVLPACARPILDVQVELDHLFRVQVAAQNLDQHVGLRGGSRRELQDEGGIEPLQRRLGVAAVRLVPLVEHDHGTQQAQRVAQRGLDLPPPEAAGRAEGIEVRDLLQQVTVAGYVVIRREEPVEAAAVPEHPQLFLGLAVGRRQHQQQDAQMVGHVGRCEAATLLQNHGAPGGGQIELLAVGMVAVLEGREGLAVDLRGWHDPQHEPGLPIEELAVDQIDNARRQQRLAAAGGNLQAERRQRLAGTGGAPVVGTPRHRRLPRFTHPIEVRVGRASLRRQRALAGKLIKETAHRGKCTPLEFLEDHVARCTPPPAKLSIAW